MNYYEHHIGDYAEATAHLSFVEDAAYSRLIRKVYATEKPLPADIKAVQRLVGARSKEERVAVETVLHEFFSLQDDGWHNERCDEEIEKFKSKQPSVAAKKENDKVRQKRARERRKALFSELRSYGITAPWDATTERLQEILTSITSDYASKTVTHGHAPVTHHVTRDNTATQTPDTRHQTPIQVIARVTDLEVPRARASVQPETQPAAACKAMRAVGLGEVNPSHPKLKALLDAGMSIDELCSAAQDAAGKGKGFAYALSVAEGRRRDAASSADLPARQQFAHSPGQVKYAGAAAAIFEGATHV